MPRLRSLALAVPLVAAAFIFSGCIAIDRQGASQRLQGFVTLELAICVSDHDRSTYSACDPDTRTQPAGTAEGDNGEDGDGSGSGRGQLLIGYRVPDGTGAPATIDNGRLSLARNPQYVTALNSKYPPPAGFHWEGYLSTEVAFDPRNEADRVSELKPEFRLPAGPGGAPFAGPFRWRAVVGFRATQVGNLPLLPPAAPVDCSGFSHECFVSPTTVTPTGHISSAVSDVGIRAGSTATVAPGETAAVTFTVQNVAPPGSLVGTPRLALSATTGVPGAAAQPAAPTLAVPPNQTPTTTVSVSVPPGTPVGTYPVTLTGTAGGAPQLVRSNRATINVVDRTAPQIRISTPANGSSFAVGQRVPADYGCADEAGGSGVAGCSGPVAPGAAIDTSSPGTKSFTVNATDGAGNATSSTRTYTVVAPPRERVGFTLAFGFPSAGRSTAFTLLQAKNVVPAGTTIVATCKGQGCPTKRRKGKRTNVVFTKNRASGTINLKPFLRRRLRAGAVITVTGTKPGAFGMVKKLKVRANKRPKLTTSCLLPDSRRRARCAQ